jgi:Cdc6-like AAA superfamily ATPase
MVEHATLYYQHLSRELSEDYSHSKDSRARLAVAVHEPASALIKTLWTEMLAERDPSGRNEVLITAGGAGSGKTATVEILGREVRDAAQIVYDTTLADYNSAIKKVEAAIAAGKRVTIFYIHRPIEKAVQGVLERAMRIGRTVPLKVLANDHFEGCGRGYGRTHTKAL